MKRVINHLLMNFKPPKQLLHAFSDVKQIYHFFLQHTILSYLCVTKEEVWIYKKIY
jgi:hypothetical protein